MAGRPKGALNRTTHEAKDAIELAFRKAGGVEALTRWARENPDGFYPVWAKLLPKNLDVTSNGETVTLSANERAAQLEQVLNSLRGRSK